MLPCSEMGMLVAALLLSGATFSTAEGQQVEPISQEKSADDSFGLDNPVGPTVGLFEKTLVFPEETDSSYVTLTPQKPLGLKAFTLCMNVATQLKGERAVILFAYRTKDNDELNIWRELDGHYSIYLRTSCPTEAMFFDIPPLNTFKTLLCVTWESSTGLTAFSVNGKRSVREVYKQGYEIQSEGTVLLGQDPDSYLGDFDAKQSFVGEISDLNMWDFVLSESQMKALQSHDSSVPKGNVFAWESVQYQIHGKVIVAPAD